jgi:hypothetical protein
MRTHARNRAVKLQKRNAGSSKKARKKNPAAVVCFTDSLCAACSLLRISYDARDTLRRTRRMNTMNLVIWLPTLFVLGLISLAACLAFTEACARI